MVNTTNVTSCFRYITTATTDTGTGTPAAVTGDTPAATTDLSSISADAKLTITIDGTAYDLDKTALTVQRVQVKQLAHLVNAINT